MIHVRLAAVAVALTLLLVGCSDDDPTPAPAPTPSGSASTSSTPTSTPSPTAAAASPVQTVKDWVAARNLAMVEGDLDPVRELSDPQCSSCADLIDPIEETYAAGGHYETKGWRVVHPKVTDEQDTKVQVVAGLVLAGGRTFHSSGADPVVYPPEKRIGIFKLAKSNDQWLVILIGFAS